MIIYHLTAHPDNLTALQEISLEAKSKGFALMDSKVLYSTGSGYAQEEAGWDAQNEVWKPSEDGLFEVKCRNFKKRIVPYHSIMKDFIKVLFLIEFNLMESRKLIR